MGSKTGWILALALIFVVVFALYFVVLDPQPSLPRETNAPGFLDLKTIDIPITEVIGREPTGAGNAGDDYQKAVQLYITNSAALETTGDIEQYEALVGSKDPWKDPALKVCKEIAAHVADGAKKRKMEYTFTYTPKRLKIGYHHAHADHLYKVSTYVHMLYMIHQDRKEFAEAEKYLKDMFVLGYHMFNERAAVQVSRTSIEILTSAVQRLQQLYDKWPDAPRHRRQSIRAYENALRLISANYRKKKQILWDNIPGNDPVTHQPVLSAGDVFNIAENDQDRSWRVQAILTLGPLKYRVSGRGDLNKTKSLIQRFLLSKDPIVEAAAKAADEMTLDQFRHMGSDFDENE